MKTLWNELAHSNWSCPNNEQVFKGFALEAFVPSWQRCCRLLPQRFTRRVADEWKEDFPVHYWVSNWALQDSTGARLPSYNVFEIHLLSNLDGFSSVLNAYVEFSSDPIFFLFTMPLLEKQLWESSAYLFQGWDCGGDVLGWYPYHEKVQDNVPGWQLNY